jgi:beta-glucosidase
MENKNIIIRMSLEDKVSFCSGADFWSTKAFEKYGIPSIFMSDGPHGLRKQEKESDHIGVNQSKAATCFPPACATACSWDRKLIEEIGKAIGEEALQEGISLVLGPGINIKRNPLCGRNFEYYSEDPYISGELGTAFVNGVEATGIGACVKHYAANNQENKRFFSDSIVDERTLREIYLAAFETAVKKAKPSSVMCAYNKVNGEKCSDNKSLLHDILRNEWGFNGFIVTDWGAMNERIAAFKAGTDLEMPGGTDFFDSDVIKAVKSGELSEEVIDRSVDRLLSFIFKAAEVKKSRKDCDLTAHHRLARRAAASSAVLLKNEDNLLPFDKTMKIAAIGEFAKKIRYQGTGSSYINPNHITNVLSALYAEKIRHVFFEGCKSDGSTTDLLLKQIAEGARTCDAAVVFAGLTENYESEGFDRETLSMPQGHVAMIKEAAKANPNTVVVLMAGSVVDMPWIDDVKAVLHMYLPGQAGGEAAVDLLFGDVNPSGKLSETYPFSYEDVPSAHVYETNDLQAQYREGIFTGYRYYDKASVPVRFPFGFGLSYTSFEYINPDVKKNADNYLVSLTVKNIGKRAGSEIVQLYVSDLQSGIPRPAKELKGFEKVFLNPGEEKRICFELDKRSFAYYDVKLKDWQVQQGRYHILIGASILDIRHQLVIDTEGTMKPQKCESLNGTWYEHLKGKPSQEEFEILLGRKIEPCKPPKKGSYTTDHSIADMQDSFIMRQMYKSVEQHNGKTYGGIDYTNPTFKMVMISSTEVPIKNLCSLSGGKLKRNFVEGLAHMANGKYIKGIMTMIKAQKNRFTS